MASSNEKEYTVTVTETKTWTVEVHASSSEEAKDLVEARHQTCEDYDEVYYDIEFEAESEDEEEVNETPRKKGDVTKMIEEAVKEWKENVNIDKSLIEVAQELQAENDKLKEENRKVEFQSRDLWELLSLQYDCNPYIIESLIELRGEEYVKDIFQDDYKDYQKNVMEDNEE